MIIHRGEDGPRRDRRFVRTLLKKRLKELHHREAKLNDPALKSFYGSQEVILEDILKRAHGHEDDVTLVQIIDLCILESRCYQKLTTDRGLKSLYGIKVRVLRAARLLIGRYLHLKKWTRRKKI